MNAKEPEVISMEREVIADKAVWTAKKRYMMRVYDSEGVRYDPPKQKIMGIETTRSSTPQVVRDSLKEEIIRLDNQPKPQPRKKRNIRAKSIKVGK